MRLSTVIPLPHSFLILYRKSTYNTRMKEDQLTRQSIIWRVGIFGLLEGAFLTLSIIGLVHPIILNLPENISLSETKGSFTALFIIWHTVAITAAKGVLPFVFSAEWVAQYERTGRLESRKTDRVSKLTASILCQIQHFFSRTATSRYRLAVVLVGLFMLLGSIGPGAVVFNTTSVDVHIDIDIANVTFPYDFDAGTKNATWTNFTRANSILRLELFDNTTFGYEPSDNVMIPWPSKQNNVNGQVVYYSDVLSFDFNCTWHKPTVWNHSLEDNSIFWRASDRTFIANATSEAFVSLAIQGPTTFFGSSWLFATYDTIFSSLDSPGLNLTGLPTTSRSEIEPKLNGSGLPIPQTVTALICDPQTEVYTAEVILNNRTLDAVRSAHPPVGNIDSREIQQGMFVSNLIPSLTHDFPDSIDGTSSTTFSSVVRLLWFCPKDSPCDTFKPFPIPNINSNMNRIFRSASKAFLDGYNGTQPDVDTLSIQDFNPFTVPALRQADKIELVTSKSFFVALVVILEIIVLSLGLLCYLIKPERLLCFNLDNVSQSVLNELERLDTVPAYPTISSLTSPSVRTIEKIYYPAHSR